MLARTRFRLPRCLLGPMLASLLVFAAWGALTLPVFLFWTRFWSLLPGELGTSH